MKNLFYKIVRLIFGKNLALKWFAKDHVRNPLLKYPVNEWCWCGSRVKAKNCCLPGVNKYIPKYQERKLKLTEYVKKIRSKQK